MSRVETLESEILQLSRDEFAELRDWLLLRDAERWDREFEADAKAGRLDAIFGKAEEDHRAGKSRPI